MIGKSKLKLKNKNIKLNPIIKKRKIKYKEKTKNIKYKI